MSPIQECRNALRHKGEIHDFEDSEDGVVWAVSEDAEGQWWTARWVDGKVKVRESEPGAYPSKSRTNVRSK